MTGAAWLDSSARPGKAVAADSAKVNISSHGRRMSKLLVQTPRHGILRAPPPGRTQRAASLTGRRRSPKVRARHARPARGSTEVARPGGLSILAKPPAKYPLPSIAEIGPAHDKSTVAAKPNHLAVRADHSPAGVGAFDPDPIQFAANGISRKLLSTATTLAHATDAYGRFIEGVTDAVDTASSKLALPRSMRCLPR